MRTMPRTVSVFHASILQVLIEYGHSGPCSWREAAAILKHGPQVRSCPQCATWHSGKITALGAPLCPDRLFTSFDYRAGSHSAHHHLQVVSFRNPRFANMNFLEERVRQHLHRSSVFQANQNGLHAIKHIDKHGLQLRDASSGASGVQASRSAEVVLRT